MRFEKSTRTPYLGKRDQIRLAMMVVLIGFVVAAIDFASRESTWYWLTGNPGTGGTPTAAPRKSETSRPKISFTPQTERAPLPPGAIRIETVDHVGEGEAFLQDRRLALTAKQVAKIRDNAVGISTAERDVYHELLARTRDIPLTEQQQAARDDVAFAVLMTESQEFLGKLITVKGEIRRLIPIPPGRNDHGIEDLWEAVMFNADSGSENPYLIRFTSLPEGIPTGMELKSGTIVEVTGFFFKRYGYPTQDDRLHVAPLVIAKTLKWFKPSQKPNDLGPIPYVLGFAGIVGSTICFLLVKFRSGDRKFEREHLRRLTEAPRDAIAAIDHLPTIDVGYTLRQMSQADILSAGDAAKTDPHPDGGDDSESNDG